MWSILHGNSMYLQSSVGSHGMQLVASGISSIDWSMINIEEENKTENKRKKIFKHLEY